MRKHAPILAVFTLFFLCAGSAMAFVLLSPPRRWFDQPRQVGVDSSGAVSVGDGDNGLSAALAATEAWNDAALGHSAIDILSAVARNIGAPTLGDGESEMVFSDPFNVCTGNCLAATFTGFFDDESTATCDGFEVVQLTDSDVIFSTRFDFTTEAEPDGCSEEIFLEAVVTHEIGHLIGLGHSQVAEALMAPTVSTCFNKPIAADDLDARDVLYDCDVFDEGDGGGDCSLGQVGDACRVDSDCCSGECSRGRPSARTCQP